MLLKEYYHFLCLCEELLENVKAFKHDLHIWAICSSDKLRKKEKEKELFIIGEFPFMLHYQTLVIYCSMSHSTYCNVLCTLCVEKHENVCPE